MPAYFFREPGAFVQPTRFTGSATFRPPNESILSLLSDLVSSLDIVFVSDTHMRDWEPEIYDNPYHSLATLESPPMHFYTGRAKVMDFRDQMNAQPPDLIIHGGDVVHSSGLNSGYDTWMEYWNSITAEKCLTIGNHDCSTNRHNNDLGLSAHDFVALKLGYSGMPKNAGSVFNQSFSVQTPSGFPIRIVILDTNINPEGEHDNQGGYFQSDVLQWLDSELRSAPESMALVFSHHGRNSIRAAYRQPFQNVLESVLNARQELTIHVFYGHTHTSEWQSFSDKAYEEHNVPALIDHDEGQYARLYFHPTKGFIHRRMRLCVWPYHGQ